MISWSINQINDIYDDDYEVNKFEFEIIHEIINYYKNNIKSLEKNEYFNKI